MDALTIILLITNLLLWPALGHLALKASRKDPQMEHLERQLRMLNHHQSSQKNPFQDAA